MRKIKSYILFIFSALLLYSCNNTPPNYYEVSGRLENVYDSVFFAVREVGDTLIADTIKINEKGEFKFKSEIDTLTVLWLYFNESPASPSILVDKGWTIHLQGDLCKPDLITAKGGNVNNDLAKFKEENSELLTNINNLLNNLDGSMVHSDSVVSRGSVVELKNMNFEWLNAIDNYVKENPTKISSVILINSFFKNEESLERLTEALNHLKGVAYDFPLAIQLREFEKQIKKSAVGAVAPNFSSTGLKNDKVNLSNYRGKYVLVTFISTTCGVCQEMQPLVLKEYNILKKEKMNIEFVSIVKDVEELAIEKTAIYTDKWAVLTEYGSWSSTIFEDYNIRVVPYSVLISPEGRILERDVPMFNLKNRLESYPRIKDNKK